MNEQNLTGAALRAKAAEEIARLKRELAEWEAVLGVPPAKPETPNVGPPLKRLVSHMKEFPQKKMGEAEALEYLKYCGVPEGYAKSAIKHGLRANRLKHDGEGFLILGEKADSPWDRKKR